MPEAVLSRTPSSPPCTAAPRSPKQDTPPWVPTLPDPRFSFSAQSTSKLSARIFLNSSRIFIDAVATSARKTWQSLSELGDLVETKATNRAEFLKECREGKLDGVVAAYRTFFSVQTTGLFDKELVDALPKSLKYLAHCGMFFFYLVYSEYLPFFSHDRRWI